MAVDVHVVYLLLFAGNFVSEHCCFTFIPQFKINFKKN